MKSLSSTIRGAIILGGVIWIGGALAQCAPQKDQAMNNPRVSGSDPSESPPPAEERPPAETKKDEDNYEPWQFSPLEEATHTMRALYAAANTSRVLWMCGYRDSHWHGWVLRNVGLRHIRELEKLSEEDQSALMAFKNMQERSMAEAMTPTGTPSSAKCHELRAAGMVEKIDQLAWRLESGQI